MNLSVWQVSGGPLQRAYDGVFLRHGVALIGPGDAGPYTPKRPDIFEEVVRRFATEIIAGDVLLLRSGISTIRAIGIVAGEYQYLPQFDDVNGWDLQHARRVRWFMLPSAFSFEGSVFGGNPPRLSRINQPEILDYALRFVNSPPDAWKNAPLPALPPELPDLDEIPPWLQPLLAQIRDLFEIYQNLTAFGELPAEDELIVHYVVPLLRALGWPVERIAVKWRYVDITLFRALPRTPENCAFIIEAKRLGAGVEGALDQAQGYLDILGVSRDIIVTDGIRYRLYSASKNFAPIGYANMARLKKPALQLFEYIRRP
jgi:hypothetical protein